MKAADMIDWECQEMSPHIKDKLERTLKNPDTVKAGTTRIERPAGVYDEAGEPEGVIDDPSQFHPGYHSSSIILVKEIGTFLLRHYPGWAWSVQVNEFGHMINILNMHLHPMYGARIRMEDIMYSPAKAAHTIMTQAGEILERFGMATHGLTGENKTRLADAPRDGVGNCIPDISDLPDKKAAHQAEIAKKIASGEIKIFEVNGQKMVRIKK